MPHSLNRIESRVLGCLIEKKLATPAAYPLTLNALLAACNQKTNRHPVLELEEVQVEAALQSLRARQLVAAQSGEGQRSLKFHERLGQRHELKDLPLALLGELLLRGEQTPGELRSRCARMVEPGSIDELQQVLDALAGGESPLIRQLERRPGQSERRWRQLLTAEDESEESTTQAIAKQEDPLQDLKHEVQALREELREMRESFAAFRRQFD